MPLKAQGSLAYAQLGGVSVTDLAPQETNGRRRAK
jgi:hypothetical protein